MTVTNVEDGERPGPVDLKHAPPRQRRGRRNATAEHTSPETLIRSAGHAAWPGRSRVLTPAMADAGMSALGPQRVPAPTGSDAGRAADHR